VLTSFEIQRERLNDDLALQAEDPDPEPVIRLGVQDEAENFSKCANRSRFQETDTPKCALSSNEVPAAGVLRDLRPWLYHRQR
jgi:hypothetical protein